MSKEINKNPTVSVIIPTYNRAHLIGRSIQSVLSQTYQDFELIVIDDGSTDNTEEVVERFNNPRIHYIRHKENRGGSAARNTGIKFAKGKYIAFQDSDDEWLPEKLEKQVKLLDNNLPKIGVVYTDLWKINDKGDKKYWHSPRIMPEDGIMYEKALDECVMNIGTQTLIVRKECFNKVGLFDENLPRFQEMEILIRLSKYYLFYHINEPLVYYYIIPDSITSGGEIPAVIAVEVIFNKYFEDIKKNRKLLAKYYYWLGSFSCRKGNIQQGRFYLFNALKSYPMNIRYWLAIIVSVFGKNIYNKVRELIYKL